VQKIYCYVDESGQDTSAQTGRKQVFVVAIAVLARDKTELSHLCEQYEKASGKYKDKWGRARHTERLRYLRLVFADDRFHACLRYSIFHNIAKKFDQATTQAIARAILWQRSTTPYVAEVFVDGLAKSKRADYRRALRELGVSMGGVHGVLRDENNALTRLADALAGFVRDAVEKEDTEAGELLKQVTVTGEVVEV
jgi:hypothetical protein